MNDPNGSKFRINPPCLDPLSPVKAICTCLVVYGWDKLYKFAQVLRVIGWSLLASNRSLASLDVKVC
uniref:Uncharacterized protein n=1 Tax=Helianthus annuus TaxID=4232 RepID=A0A251URZ2_HELAN